MGLMKKLTSAVVASSLVLGLVGTAFAAPTGDEQSAAFARMNQLGVVEGITQPDGTKIPGLDQTLTRAQLLTVIVRAFGQEANAKILGGVASFDDVPANEWYSGYVAVAKQLAAQKGFHVGYNDGTFVPNKEVTNIEALAFVMKFLGVTVGNGDNWVADTIANAKNAGVITDADAQKFLDAPNAPATRGQAFALADHIFAGYNKLAGGKTVYTSYVDTEAPTIFVNKPAAPTTNEASYTLTGKIDGATEAFVGTEKITLNADGTFSAVVALNAGENKITVSAKDLAGNVAETSFSLTRTAGAAAKIAVESTEVEVAAGAEAELGYKVVDATGLELADAAKNVKATVAGEIGKFEDGKFTAAEKAGTGTITLSYEGLEAVTLNVKVVAAEMASVKAETDSVAPGEAVKLVAVDKYGNAVEGATFSENAANAFIEGDKFTATKAGEYEVTATKGETSVTGKIAVFGELDALKIDAPAKMVANGETKYKVTVKAVDKNGAVVRTFDKEIRLESDLDFSSSRSVKAVDGVATFELKVPVDMEEADLIATYDDITSKVTVETVEQKATALKLETSKFLGLGWRALPFSGKVKVVDQEGVAMKSSDDWQVTLKVSGPAYFAGGEEKRTLKDWATKDGLPFELESADFDTEGDVTITATATDLKEATATIKAVYAGAPKNLVFKKESAGYLNAGSVYRIGLTDRNEVPVYPATNHKVKLTFNVSEDDLKVTWGYTKDADTYDLSLTRKAGEVTFDTAEPYVYVRVTSKNAKNSVSVRATSDGLNSANTGIEIKASTGEKLSFEKADNDVFNVRPDTPTDLVFQVADEFGNPVKDIIRVDLEATGRVSINGKSKVTIYTDADGKGRVKVEAPWSLGSASASITAYADFDKDGYTDLAGELEIVLAQSAARSFTLTEGKWDSASKVWTTEGSIAAGSATHLRLQVRDNLGKNLVPAEGYNDEGLSVEVDGNNALNKLEWVEDHRGNQYAVIDLTGYQTAGKHTVVISDAKSLYQPEKSFDYTVADPNKAAQVKVDNAEIVTTAFRAETVTAYLYAADGTTPATSADVEVSVTVTGTGQYRLAGGVGWLNSGTKVTVDATNEFALELRGDVDGGNVVFTITVKPVGGSALASKTVTLKK